jgi:hypothetical protein
MLAYQFFMVGIVDSCLVAGCAHRVHLRAGFGEATV